MHETPRSPSPRHTVTSRISLTLFVLLTALCIALPLFAGPSSGTDVLIPAVARDSDFAGSSPSTFSLTNPSSTTVLITLQLYRRGVSQAVPESRRVALAAYETRRYEDALDSLFQTGGAGAIRVTSEASVLVTSRSLASARSSIGFGQVARMRPDADSADASGSLSIVETSGGAAIVRMTLRDIAGTELGSLESPIGPYEERAWTVSDVLPGIGVRENSNVEATVVVGSGRVVVFASPTKKQAPRRAELLAAAK